MIERIVIALDGSHRAELAVPYAAYVGAMLGARMELLTVTDKPGQTIVELDQSVQRSLAEAQGLMSTWIRSIDISIVDGDPAEAIIAHAGSGSTLVAMATHGRTGIMRRVAGSVAEGVLRASQSPLLLVQANDNSTNIRHPARISNVLLPLDMNETAEGALPLARLFAEKLNAGVTLLNVSDEARAVDYMDGVASYFKGLKSTVDKQFRTGEPGQEITDAAKNLAAPVIVMCSKRANVETGSIRGSVTDYVVRHAECPVAVVPFSVTKTD